MISAVKAVRDHSQLKGLHKHSILALATHANKDGSNAHVSQATIADREGINRGVVNAAFKQARENGEIVQTGKTFRGVGIYTFAPFITQISGVHQVDRSDSTCSPGRQVPVHPVDTYLSTEQTGRVHPVNTYIPSSEQVTDQAHHQPSEKMATPRNDRFQKLKLRVEQKKREEEASVVA